MTSDRMPTAARRRIVAAPPDQPNLNDYAKIVPSADDPGRFEWQIFAGNHHLTHHSNGSYANESNARRALRREHPDVELRE